MLETIKNWLNDFKTDFDFDFDPMDCSFLNWLRSLLMMLGAYWLAVAVPMAIVNHFRPGKPIGNDSFYIEYLDLRPFNFTFKYVGHTIIRILVVGLWCGLMMLYGIFIYPFTHASGGNGATDYGGGSPARDESNDDGDRRERPRYAPQPDPPRSSQPQSPSSSPSQPPPRSEPKQPVTIVAAYNKGTTVYFKRSDGYEKSIAMVNMEVVGFTATTVSVRRVNNPDKGIYVFDVDGYQKGYINVPS